MKTSKNQGNSLTVSTLTETVATRSTKGLKRPSIQKMNIDNQGFKQF